MSKRISLDPITRIEGHLRVDVEVTNGVANDAWVSAQMWRGIETILRGREPQDAWALTQRICGVCTTVHAIASIRAVEQAVGAHVPINAQYLRNIMIAQHAVQDHIVHFYQLSALDWVDAGAALKADPSLAARFAQNLSDWPVNGEKEFASVKERLKNLLEGGRGGLFASGYGGHPAMKLPPEVNLVMMSHYLQALDYQRKAAQAVALIGGKTPHIQNLCLGGVATAINMENMATLNVERLAYLRALMEDSRRFVRQVYYPDVLALASAYREWFRFGAGVNNYLSVAEFPEDAAGKVFAMNGGWILDGNLAGFHVAKDQLNENLMNTITEHVSHSWYEGKESTHPWKGETNPQYTNFNETGKYSWCKAPRFNGKPFQVGPLAQILTCYASGDQRVRTLVDAANSRLGIGLNDYHSVMGRILARAQRTCVMADLSLEYLDKLIGNISKGDTAYVNHTEIPSGEIRGVGFHEAPRGILSHWVVIKDRKIDRYQVIVPSTWNASPRDASGVRGPYESSLIGTPVAQEDKPLELLRTVHSFDPCISCAVHLFNPGGS
jgi:hydrogenase large subunit